MKKLCQYLILTITFLFMFSGSGNTRAPDSEQDTFERVLVIYSYGKNMPSNTLIDQGIRETFENSAELQVEFYTEYMDSIRFSDDQYLDQLRELYRYKYSLRKIDLIIVAMPPALDFVLQYGDELFPDTPVVFCVIDEHRLRARQLSDNMTGTLRKYNVKDTLDVALELQPTTRQVMVIFDETVQESINMTEAVQEVLEEYETRLEFHYTGDLTVEDWQAKAAQLPPQTIIFYVNLTNGSEGKVYTPQMALSRIAETSSAPIYGLFDTYLGYGIVGGHLSSYKAQGQKAAKLGIQIMNGSSPAAMPITAEETNIYMFDWKQLERHNISEEYLPAGSIVIDKQPSIWDLYKWWIVTGIAVLITESLLLILLLFQRMIRQRAEDELQEYREQLEDLVDERTVALKREITEHKRTAQDLQKAKESAEAANQAKSVFLTTMSHELRTPLNGILGYAQILDRNPDVSPRQRDGLHVIMQSGDHLLNLIDDILDLAKVEAGKIKLHEDNFSLHALVYSVAEIVRVRAERKGLAFVLQSAPDVPDVVCGDERRLRQVLLNLLGNAAKFTHTGSVTFRVTRGANTATGRALVRFEIEDTGIGIPPDAQSVIFEPFEQVEKGGRGSGLGLAISHSLIKLMGGAELHLRSTVEVGSTFWFELALTEVSTPVEPDSRAERRIVGIHGPPPRILVVDDKRENRAVLLDLLASLGFETIEAQNGHEGLEKARAQHPAAVIADLLMPEMDGFEMIRRLRRSEGLRDVPIIATSASVYAQDQRKSLDAGATFFLPKPVRVELLLEQIQQCLQIEWRYAQEARTPPSLATLPIVAPSPDEIVPLLQSARAGNIRAIQQHADALAQADPRYKPLADKVHRMAQNLHIDAIRALLEDIYD